MLSPTKVLIQESKSQEKLTYQNLLIYTQEFYITLQF